MREVPKELRREVFDLITEILSSEEVGDTRRSAEALGRLRAVCARQEALGQPDPAVTETLAAYSDDAAEAATSWRLAIAQSAAYPDEPTHTKRINLGSRLIELGDFAGARLELTQGRADAERLKDALYVELADELLSRLAI